ncbi:coiled-coil domain-containing protein AGAP005037-like isoform X3 [Pomacea canaliculata]|uniref:coiled-coil domain-containing protein AGAP005037-like isoform X3 n=1 Tax=Pomacea canaliculata TaxID=400727 RepID=UPI000D72A0E8|nr:coiled-coil domain-containing protein AGAP005037-like isoform X3 [Pomacea canaliculata]
MFFNKTRRKLCTKVPLKIPSFSKTDKKRPEGVAVDNKASVTEKKLDTKSDGGRSPPTPSSEGKSESTVQQLQHEQQQQQQPVAQQPPTPTPSPQSSLQQRQPQEQLQHPPPQEQPSQLQHQSMELHPASRQLPQPQLRSPQQVQRHPHSLPPPKPPHVDDLSSSDTQNSDWESPYSTMRTSQARGRQGHVSESDGEVTPVGSLRRAAPRRHTVGGADIREQMEIETERKREAFYELLAHRYPEYADKITAQYGPVERIPRPREPQRRRTTIVNYIPRVYGPRAADYEDPGTMSDMDLPSFQRGGYARASLPVVRSASSSLERPLGERSLGLVFLLFRDETKKALLPNEITSLDTVRAMFVRAFPEKLTMEFLDSPKRKIYILEAATNIFFQLEDLRDIKDRTVLKIHECESAEPQRVKCPPEVRGRAMQPTAPPPRSSSRPGYSPDYAPVQVYQSREELAKAQSLPVSVSHNYQDLMQKERVQWELEQEYAQKRSRSRSQTPEPAERPRSLSTGGARTRFSHSPDRLPTPDRTQHLNPIPENPRLLANGFREELVNGNNYEGLSGRHPQGHHSLGSPTGHHPPGARVLSPPPVGGPLYDSVYASYAQPQAFITHSMRAGPSTGPQRATAPPLDGRSGNRPPHSYASMPGGVAPVYDGGIPQRSQSYRVPSERDLQRAQSSTTHYPEARNRMERMEAQIASLAAWVHNCQTPTENVRRGPGSSRSMSSTQSEGTDTIPGSTTSKLNGESSISSSVATNSLDKQGLSDIPSASYSLPQPVVTVDMREKIITVQNRLKELRKDFQSLRRMEQLNQEAMRDSFNDTFAKIKKVILAVPGAENQVLCYKRLQATTLTQEYLDEKDRVEKELSDLEASVEELKDDVLARRCRVNANDVEAMALMLSNITKSLADLKARFPDIQTSLKNVMSAEMEIVVKEERFLKEEPAKIEEALKRCKKLTGTLYTLKRLAAEQNQCLPQVPSLAGESNKFGENEKMAVLENIRSMVPDHKIRVQSMESTMHGNKAVDGEPSSRTECIVKENAGTITSHFNEKGKQLVLPTKPACTLSDNARTKLKGRRAVTAKLRKHYQHFQSLNQRRGHQHPQCTQ